MQYKQISQAMCNELPSTCGTGECFSPPDIHVKQEDEMDSDIAGVRYIIGTLTEEIVLLQLYW